MFARWAVLNRVSVHDDLQGLYETPMKVPQMRALFRLYPQLDVCHDSFDESIHTRSLSRTPSQKMASRMKHKYWVGA